MRGAKALARLRISAGLFARRYQHLLYWLNYDRKSYLESDHLIFMGGEQEDFFKNIVRTKF